MSIAWSSLVIVVLLLPGILFFAGTYLPEQFTRETENRSALGHLGGAILISFCVHGLAFSVLPWLCGSLLPCIDLGLILSTITFDPRGPVSAAEIGSNVHSYRWWIFLYVLLTAATGVFLGYRYGLLSVKGKTGGLSRHAWIRDLRVNGVTYCHVLTHIKHEDRVLLYRGWLWAFGLQNDGRFSYLVLSDVCREYLVLQVEGSVASRAAQLRTMGSAQTQQMPSRNGATVDGQHKHSLFAIEGEDIANAVFDVYELSQEGGRPSIATLVTQESAQLRYRVAKELIDALEEAAGGATLSTFLLEGIRKLRKYLSRE